MTQTVVTKERTILVRTVDWDFPGSAKIPIGYLKILENPREEPVLKERFHPAGKLKPDSRRF
jgi:hypothetical protein